MGEIAERVQGNDGRMDLPTLTISAANGWMDQKERFSGNIAGKEQKKYTLLHKGELSYNHGNSKLAKYGTVFSLETYEEALVPRVYHSFKVINGSSKFIEYYFATKIPDRELAKLVSSGARMDGLLNINFNEFMGINLALPNKSEQEKISDYFSKLDHLITLHQRKLFEAKNNPKNGSKKFFRKIYQKLYKFDFNFKTYDWEQRKLGEECEITMGQSPAGNTYSDVPSDFILVQGNADLKDGWVHPRIWTTQKTKTADAGDLIMSVRAPAGAMGKTAYDVVLGRGVAGIKGDEFIFQMLSKMSNDGYWKKLSSGSTFESINSNDIKDSIIKMPSDKIEQQKIGECFSNLDRLITLHQREVFYTLKHIFYRCCDTLLSGGL